MDISNTNVTEIDTENLQHLKLLYMQNIKIHDINVDPLLRLEVLDARKTKLSALHDINMTELRKLIIDNTAIREIDTATLVNL